MNITQAEYLKHHGMRCPFCASVELGWTDDIYLPEKVGRLHQRVKCLTCKREWWDFYRLCGFRRIKQ